MSSLIRFQIGYALLVGAAVYCGIPSASPGAWFVGLALGVLLGVRASLWVAASLSE